MKLSKKIIISLLIVIVLVVSNYISYYVGGHYIERYENKINVFDKAEMHRSERELANSLFDLLHAYWQYQDVVYDDTNKDSIICHHPFFDTMLRNTKMFHKVDSIMGHDWEDFFEEWEDKYAE